MKAVKSDKFKQILKDPEARKELLGKLGAVTSSLNATNSSVRVSVGKPTKTYTVQTRKVAELNS